jgi:hypothetical protein
MMKTRVLALASLLGLYATAASAIDLNDLWPCMPAAARFCDRNSEMTWSNLRLCGARLAAHSTSVGDACREVLRRYRQL